MAEQSNDAFMQSRLVTTFCCVMDQCPDVTEAEGSSSSGSDMQGWKLSMLLFRRKLTLAWHEAITGRKGCITCCSSLFLHFVCKITDAIHDTFNHPKNQTIRSNFIRDKLGIRAVKLNLRQVIVFTRIDELADYKTRLKVEILSLSAFKTC